MFSKKHRQAERKAEAAEAAAKAAAEAAAAAAKEAAGRATKAKARVTRLQNRVKGQEKEDERRAAEEMRKSLLVCGLQNLGLECWANALLQSLASLQQVVALAMDGLVAVWRRDWNFCATVDPNLPQHRHLRL